MTTIVKRCGYGTCRVLVPVSARYCAEHRRKKSQTYGRKHREARPQIMAQAGWACHYCGHPVTLHDDIIHLQPTQTMTPAQAQTAPRAPAHRACHNKHAPHLTR